MMFVILANEALKQEMLSNGTTGNVGLAWIEKPEQLLRLTNADVLCDLMFDGSEERIELLKKTTQPVIINSPEKSYGGFPFIRINAWPGFLKGSIIEATCPDETKRETAENFFLTFNKKLEWLPDEPGFISARIVAMIINEAHLALAEGVSTKDEIDTAMKLGTNYPYGPFEWSEKIGLHRIHELLMECSKIHSRYQPYFKIGSK